MVTCQEMLLDHACTLPLALLWPEQNWPVKIVPVCINTVLFPLPSAQRCWRSARRGPRRAAWHSDARVLVLGTGGLSHQLDGERAGFINKAFDTAFMDSLAGDPAWATQFSVNELVEQAGTQGIELLDVARRARCACRAACASWHRNYHIPISNTAAGMMLFDHRG